MARSRGFSPGLHWSEYNLGISYGVISEQLYTAVQNALSGASSPADALAEAQATATEKLQEVVDSTTRTAPWMGDTWT